MAFTAGSVELARANRLGNQLAHLFSAHGLTGAVGLTGAKMIEKYAKKAGFGITGITTGNSFPPFGSFSGTQSGYAGIEAALQNPRGETMAAGISIGSIAGQTVGIYMKNRVRNGADYKSTIAVGVTLATAMNTAAGTSFWVRGPVNVQYQDRLIFGDATYIVALGGNTSAAAGGTANISIIGTIASTYATGAAFNVEVIGVTRGTNGVYGITFENYAAQSGGGFTANIYYNAPSGGSGTWTVS